MKKLTLLLFLLPTLALSAEICSRVATINYQEVLVDVSSNNKGEGLRYYLEKDPVSKELLDQYQENNKSSWKSAALSTLGTAMILGSLVRANEGESETITSRNSLLFGGIAFMGISYLISKTNQYNNEFYLRKSVEEYNKRNTPRIYFAPAVDTKSGGSMGFGVGMGQEF